MSWWGEYKETRVGPTPTTPGHVVESDTKPEGNWWGPFHCEKCAEICTSFGKSEEDAYTFVHDEGDASFCIFLSC